MSTKTYRRIYAIPDVHGERAMLDRALTEIAARGFDPNLDTIVFLGDLIDRGPDSCGVIEIVRLIVRSGQGFAVRGNHDDFAVDAIVKNRDSYIWDCNGKHSTDKSYPNGRMTDKHAMFLGTLPYSLELQGFFFSHAPVPRENKRSIKGIRYSVHDLTWTYFGPECERPGGMMDVHEGPRADCGEEATHLIGVCGHIQRGRGSDDPELKREIRIFPQYRMLDTGCGYPWGRLAVHECISGETFYIDQPNVTDTPGKTTTP